jgi:hypothetical protein
MNLSQELQNFLTYQVDTLAALEEVMAVHRLNTPSETSIQYAMRQQFEYLFNRDETQAAYSKLTLTDLQTLASFESLLTGESLEVDIRFRKL